MNAKRGFSLAELLVVILILTVLAGILFPVMSRAKLSAKEGASKSNLRQLVTAANLYESDHGSYPRFVSDDLLKAKDAACDGNDYWRKSCNDSWDGPLVGSYGYLGLGEDLNQGERFHVVPEGSEYPLFVNIWYSGRKHNPFTGQKPTRKDSEILEGRFLYAFSDGHIEMKKMIPVRSSNSVRGFVFDWSNLFQLGKT